MTMEHHMTKGMLGRNRILEVKKGSKPLLEMARIRSILRCQDSANTSTLEDYLHIATHWMQEQLGKSLVPCLRESVSYNHHLVLPYGPVHSEEDILKVIYRGKELKREQYQVRVHKDSFEVSIPFSWKLRTLTVQYKAGYTSTQVPEALKNALMNTIEYLHHNNGNMDALRSATAPWIDPFREYRIF